MTPLKSSALNLKAGVVSMQRSFILHILTMLQKLLQSSKICRHLSIFLILPFFLTCSFSWSPRLSQITFFLFSHIFSTVLFHYHRGYHVFLFLFCSPLFFVCSPLWSSRLSSFPFFLLLSSFFKCSFFHHRDYHS